jgi:hypothetical protein
VCAAAAAAVGGRQPSLPALTVHASLVEWGGYGLKMMLQGRVLLKLCLMQMHVAC